MWFTALSKDLLENRIEKTRVWRRGSISIEERLGAGSKGGPKSLPMVLGARKSVALAFAGGLILCHNTAESDIWKTVMC